MGFCGAISALKMINLFREKQKEGGMFNKTKVFLYFATILAFYVQTLKLKYLN